MIKLTRGALTMLLAQYRGILKNAWIKNFAVAAALATTVTSAYAEAQKVETWDAAVKTGEGAIALDGTSGVLNLQKSIAYDDTPEKVTITGGVAHKIGGENTEQIILFSEQKVGDPDLEALYKTNKKELVIDASQNVATLTIANGTGATGVALGKVTVGGHDTNKATLNLQNHPTSQGYDEDKDLLQYSSIHNLTVLKNGEVNNSGYTDLEDRTIIEKDGVLTNTGILNIYGENNEVAGTLTSSGIISFDSNNLTVKDGGIVKVQGTLNLADVGPVNINKLIVVGDGKEGKITLTEKTDFIGNKLSLSKEIANVKSLSGLEVTLGGNEYENDGLVADATVTTKLTALAKDGAYKINKDENITLDNESGKGEVASDLEVAGGTLTVKAGTWNAEGLKVSKGQSEGDNSTVSVESNAVLALKTLEIANGQTLTVKVKGSNDGDVDGVLDLTNAKLVNDTAESDAKVKGTIDNSGIVKIGGETLAKAIANGDKDKGYIFNNEAGAQIQVAGDATLATTAFLGADGTGSGIKNAGTLAVGGALTVNGEKDKASELKNAGNITASSLTLKGMDYDKSKDEGTNDDALFTVTDGTYNIAGTVSTGSDLKIGKKATVNAQSLEAHTIDVEGGKVGSAEKPLTSIKAGGEFTSLAGSNVFAGTISADELVDLNGEVTADKITSGDKFTVTAGIHKFGEVSSAKDFTVTAGSLTLGDVTAANINVDDGSVIVKGALSTGEFTQKAGSVTVTDGSFTATEASVVGVALNNATANIGTLTAKKANSLTLDESTATVGSFGGSEAVKDTVTISKGSTLTITANQTAATEKDSAFFKNNATGDAITGKEGTLAVNAGALDLKKVNSEAVYSAENKFAKGTIGVLKINNANTTIEATSINGANLQKLIDAVSHSTAEGEKFDGKLQLVGVTADISGIEANDEGDATDGSLNYDDVKVFAQLAGDTTLESVTVNAGDGITAVSGDVGNLVANAGAGKVSIAEATLQGSGTAGATNGYYVSAVKGPSDAEKNQVVALGAELDNGSSLTLAGDGKIGAVKAKVDDNGTLAVTGKASVVKLDDGKEVLADVGTTGENLSAVNVSGALTANEIFTKALESSGSVVAANITTGAATIKAGSVNVGDATVGGAFTMEGGALTATENAATGATGVVTLKDESKIKAGSITAKDLVAEKTLTSAGNITAENLTAKEVATIKAGSVNADVASFEKALNMEGGVVNAKEVTLADTTTIIGGASLIADKVTGDGGITVGQDDVPNGTGSIYAKTLTSAGKIFIDPDFGQQAAFVGAEHLNTNGGIEVTTGDIVVGKNAALAVGVSSVEQARSVLSSLGLTDANGSFKKNGVKNAIYTDALVKLNGTTHLEINSANTDGNPTGDAGQIKLGDKSAVVIGKNAAAKSVATNTAVLTAENGTVGVRATGKSKVIFAGNPTKQDIKDVKVFGNAIGPVIDATEVDNVSVQISPLYNEAKLTVDGGITDITVNRGYINTALYNASLPVKNLVAEVADTALTGDGVGSDFIMENALVDGGANIESAARLATFGGAYQAAAAAVNTGIDAAQARLGLGIDNSSEVKGEDISVWANAVYKNTESDSFEAQGANYGADLDLTSLVIGADYNMAEGSKVGAYATFGTGDVDGKGAGHNVKNDVDTYGFGIYGSAKLASGVSILSDVGYTVAQNEFKGIVNADADMKVFTAGANVKYTFNTQVADISPFVGARYTSFNLESYAVKSTKGIVANTDADTAHIFSIPVGFDLSKQITAGEWNVKPAFTAKVTFNTGDKTVSSSTQFTGVKNTLNLDAEVMDDVTYSVGASVSAAKGAATFGAGLSYTGSSETNELSAQIGARYTF